MAGKALTLDVHGMACEGCASNVAKALESVKGVRNVEVSLEKRTATVWFDPQKANELTLKKSVTKAGYLVGDTY